HHDPDLSGQAAGPGPLEGCGLVGHTPLYRTLRPLYCSAAAPRRPLDTCLRPPRRSEAGGAYLRPPAVPPIESTPRGGAVRRGGSAGLDQTDDLAVVVLRGGHGAAEPQHGPGARVARGHDRAEVVHA